MSNPLASWLIAECEKRNLSWAEASRKAGLSKSTISDIVNGRVIGLDACKQFAEFFDVPVEFVLRKAGHLLPKPEQDELAEQAGYLLTQMPPALRNLSIDILRTVAYHASALPAHAEPAFTLTVGGYEYGHDRQADQEHFSNLPEEEQEKVVVAFEEFTQNLRNTLEREESVNSEKIASR